MTFFLPERPRETGAPALEQPPASYGETFAAGVEAERIEVDAWNRARKTERAVLGELQERLNIDPGQPPLRGGVRAQQSRQVYDYQLRETLAEAARQRAAGAPGTNPGDMPATREEFDALVLERRRADLEEAQDVLDVGAGGGAETFGRLYAGVTDEATIATLPFGGFGGGVGRVALTEFGLGVISEAAMLERQFEVAEDLDLADPNVLLQLGTAGAMSGVLGGTLEAARIGATRYSSYRATRDQATGDQAIEPTAGGVMDAEEAVAEGAEALDRPGLQLPGQPMVRQILDFIGDAEAPRGYNQVFSGIAAADAPPRPITEMTIDEVLAWQDAIDPRYNSEAAGRYQIMEDTLRGLKQSTGLRGDEVFSAEMQDRLAIALMEEKGLSRFLNGQISATQFGNNIAQTWAGLPVLSGSNRGRSYYDGFNGNGATVGARAFQRALTEQGAYKSSSDLFEQPTFRAYRTSRGYTGEGQVTYGDNKRVDVEYQVVDASLLRQATGDLQPRDRTRSASDVWVNDTAAALDPAQLMPAPTADRGAPLVGPDNIIESGNGRVRAIQRAYQTAPDRIEAYRNQIVETTGAPIPEGIEQPVLIARRTSELDEAARRELVIEAQDSGVARMTASERARIGQSRLTADTLDLFRPGARLSAAENRDFARQFLAGFPRSERNTFTAEDGSLSQDGLRQLQDSLFSRAWDAPDLVAARVELEPGDAGAIIRALDQAAPAFARLRAGIEAGQVRPEFDISGYVIDAARLIDSARQIARQENAKMSELVEELLNDRDLFGVTVAPLTQALVGKFWRGGKTVRAETIAEFLTKYADEAMTAGRAGEGLAGDVATVQDVLRSVDKAAFRDLGELGTLRATEPPQEPPESLPAYDEGALSPEAADGDLLAREELEADLDGTDTPEPANDNLTEAERAAARAELQQLSGDAADMPFDIDGRTVTARDLLRDLDDDQDLIDAIDACLIGGRANG